MAVAAINAVVADVVLVTKLDRLLSLNPLPGVPGRTVQFRGYPQRRDENENRPINRQLGERVRTVMKNLWHRRRFANSSLKKSAISGTGKFRSVEQPGKATALRNDRLQLPV
jgi:hypothetical protein